jgi:hypothetical protein
MPTADSKVSALTPATSVSSSDYVLLVQGGNSKKIDMQTLFQNIPVKSKILEASEAPLSGAVSTLLLTSKIKLNSTATAYTLGAGTHGMEKELVVDSGTGTAVVTVTSGKTGLNTITFTSLLSSAKLKNIDGVWYIVSVYTASIA